MRTRTASNPRVRYEPEADILAWELSDKDIDYAKEIGNIVVHFTKNNLPVLVEILEASQFLSKAERLMRRESDDDPQRKFAYA